MTMFLVPNVRCTTYLHIGLQSESRFNREAGSYPPASIFDKNANSFETIAK